MAAEKLCFKDYITDLNEMLDGGIPGAITPNLLASTRVNSGRPRLVNYHRDYEEEQEQTKRKIDVARNIFSSMINTPNVTRQAIIDSMIQNAGITNSTAVSYYERLAKEAGITNSDHFGGSDDETDMTAGIDMSGEEMDGTNPSMEDDPSSMDQLPDDTDFENDLQQEIEHTYPDNPNKQGIIRTVDKAHLVYKRQTPDGTFEELWAYNIGTQLRDELTIRRNILAGTDIPAQKTRSPDGSQSYTLATMGNAQLLHITGLSN